MKTIFRNATVYTGGGQFASAFAVEDGVIRAVGSDEELSGLPADARVDLGGRFVCPGFHDSHLHLLGYGLALDGVDLAAHTGSLAGLLDALRVRLLNDPPPAGGWLRGRGWNQDYFTDAARMPDRRDLDSVSTAVPIVVTRCCGHCCAANSRALALAGIGADTPDPAGGAVGRGPDGEPDGRLFDNAMELLTAAIPLPDGPALERLIARACRKLNSYGVTAVQSDDYCVFPELDWRTVNAAFEALDRRGELTVRVWEQCNFADEGRFADFLSTGLRTGAGTGRFRIGPLKLLGDGALGSRTAHLSRDYREGGGRGFSLLSEERLNALVSMAHGAGMQIAVHAIGDACLDRVLDALERAQIEIPRPDPRHGIVHCQVTRREQLERIRDLGLQVYAQTIFLDYDSHIVPRLLPPELAESSYRWRTLAEMGVRVSNGTDSPVEPPDALRGMRCAVTGQSLDGTGPLHPEERFSVAEALDSFTIRSAEARFAEGWLGRIAPGCAADLVVLGANPFETPPEELHTIPVEETWLDGEKVYGKG